MTDTEIHEAWLRICELANRDQLVINPSTHTSLFEECQNLGIKISRIHSKRDVIIKATSSFETYKKLREASFDFMAPGGGCIR